MMREAKLRSASGQFKGMKNPRPSIAYIEQTGEVEISFDQEMHVVPNLDMLRFGKVRRGNQELPVFQVEVEPYFDQDP